MMHCAWRIVTCSMAIEKVDAAPLANFSSSVHNNTGCSLRVSIIILQKCTASIMEDVTICDASIPMIIAAKDSPIHLIPVLHHELTCASLVTAQALANILSLGPSQDITKPDRCIRRQSVKKHICPASYVCSMYAKLLPRTGASTEA